MALTGLRSRGTDLSRVVRSRVSANPDKTSSPEILDISSPLTKSAVFHIPKKIKHGGREDSNGKEADFVRNFTQFKLC